MEYVGKSKDYISNILGLVCTEKGDMRKSIAHFPSILANFFDGNLIVVEGMEYVLLKSLSSENGLPISVLIRRVKSAVDKLGRPCILYMDAMNGEQRRQLLKHKICFIVPGRQLYIPTLGAYFIEKKLNEQKEVSALTPAAQMLVLYYLLRGGLDKKGLKEIAESLNYPPKTISLVASEIQQAGLCDIVTLGGRSKGIAFNYQGKELWEYSLPMLSSPVDKVGYTYEKLESCDFPLSYDDALSYYTDMGYMPGHTFAVEKRSEVGKRLLKNVFTTNAPDSTRIEFWKYNPSTLADKGFIDPLSMALIYRDYDDERVQGQIERLLNRIL